MKLLKFPLKESGFTIVEILVSLFILLIIIIPFTALFINSYTGIFTAGKKSDAQYDVQQLMENAIADHSSSGTSNLDIYFPTPISVTGDFITFNQNYNDANGIQRTLSITAFVPNK